MITAERYHDISMGHRVHGHMRAGKPGPCANLHGHNYRITFTCASSPGNDAVDAQGMVLDFGVMKDLLCTWLEDNWDHKFLMWDQDGSPALFALINKGLMASSGVVMVPFNPTAENIGNHLLHYIGPELLKGTGVTLFSVKVEETRKCSATVNLI